MNISGPAAVAKPEMLFYAPGDLTVTSFSLRISEIETTIEKMARFTGSNFMGVT